MSGGQHRQDRNFRRNDQGRNDQGRNRDRFNDRGDRNGDRDRQGYDRDRPVEGRPPQDRAPQDRPPQDQQAAGEGGDVRRRERLPQQAHEQPEFLRRPVRRARTENGESAPAKDEPND